MLPAIRPYAPADLDPLIDCWFDTWHATFAPRLHPQPRHHWRRRFLDDYSHQAEIWLAPHSTAVAGFLVLLPEAGWLEQLFVAPPYQRRGLGRALLALARFRCPASPTGHGGLALDTPVENLPAREFYRRHGFRAQQIGFDTVTQRLTLRYACEALRSPYVTPATNSNPTTVITAPNCSDRG